MTVVLILVLPGLVSWPTSPPEFEELALEPLRIDVDRAPWYEWALLEGIGEARARRIVRFIERHGPLESIDELENVPGIPSGWLDKARPHLFLPER